ncbi:NAD(P)-binding domain-containing protein [Streptomyces sp. NPDC020875]|uniref:NAD(P)-dependent oxidoreductase n=1 Tax=Streptomyces sp. NPDC020875 TaxID=3154898 RepID=UPI0033EFE6C8
MSAKTRTTTGNAVTVIGLGPMGRALAAAFLKAGVATTVWNRTPGRDRELAAAGAVAATSPEEAVAANELIVVCVVDYDATDAILRRPEVTAALKGRTVVNLSADVPARAREAGEWAAEHGVRYLDGAIMVPTTVVGTPDGVFLYSGPAELYAEHKPVLDALDGGHTHLGEDIGRAAAFDIALLDIWWTSMTGYMHALAIARAEGISGRELAPFAQGIGKILPPSFDEAAIALDDGTHTAVINPMTSSASTMAHIIHASEAHGIDASIMRAVEGVTRRAIGLGHGDDDISRVAELLGRRA